VRVNSYFCYKKNVFRKLLRSNNSQRIIFFKNNVCVLNICLCVCVLKREGGPIPRYYAFDFQTKCKTCRPRLISRHGNLVSCRGELLTCRGDFLTCRNDLVTCRGDLVTCCGHLVSCRGHIVICPGDLVTCRGKLEKKICMSLIRFRHIVLQILSLAKFPKQALTYPHTFTFVGGPCCLHLIL
jgi:hypothetical protein